MVGSSAWDTYGVRGRPSFASPPPGCELPRPCEWDRKGPPTRHHVRVPPAAGLRRDCNGGRLACEHSAPLAITPRLSVRPPDGHIRLMKARAAESNVVKFLRVALVDGAHAVTRLEASARAAGLLNERQRITHTRAFRQAKKSLRIRSLRAGFGSRSHWLWELPREDERSARAERKAAPLRRIPSDWIEGIARLNADRPPSDVPRHRWRQFVNDCTNFLSPSEGWAERAARLGWDNLYFR